MPRLSINYQNCVIYKLVCNDLNITDVYVGHTTCFKERKSQHKTVCNNENSHQHNLKVYQFIRQNGGFENWSMIEIEKHPCSDKCEALKRERYWIENTTATLNSCIPSRTKKEYAADHSEKIKANSKEYRENNMEKIKEHKKEYAIENAEHIKEYQKEYAIDNIESIKEQKHEYYENNIEKHKEQMKAYRENNIEKIKEQMKEYYKQNAEHIKEYQKNNAKSIKTKRKQYLLNNADKIREQRRQYLLNKLLTKID